MLHMDGLYKATSLAFSVNEFSEQVYMPILIVTIFFFFINSLTYIYFILFLLLGDSYLGDFWRKDA